MRTHILLGEAALFCKGGSSLTGLFVLPMALQRIDRDHMFQGRNCSASRGFSDSFFLFPLLKVVLFSIPINGC